MRIIQTRRFQNTAKKLLKNEKRALDDAVKALMQAPDRGEEKRGDLAGVRVYKFRMNTQLVLLTYSYDEDGDQLTLLAVGSHENFYRDLKQL